MKILISPAKSLDFDSTIDSLKCTQPVFLNKTSEINSVLKEKSPKDLMQLQGISQKLSDLNWKRNNDYVDNHNNKNSRPAVYAFNGDVYNGLDAYSFSKEQINTMQNQLFILSGLYGILKPLDLIKPYRLEMGTPLKIGTSKNLYDFWKNKITEKLNSLVLNDDLLVNLASKEYFDVINHKILKGRVISPIFKDFKNGKFKIISFFAKKARGMMARHLIETQATSYSDILSFNKERYQYSDRETTSESSPVFIR